MDRECAVNGDVHQDIVHLVRGPLDSVRGVAGAGNAENGKYDGDRVFGPWNVPRESMSR